MDGWEGKEAFIHRAVTVDYHAAAAAGGAAAFFSIEL